VVEEEKEEEEVDDKDVNEFSEETGAAAPGTSAAELDEAGVLVTAGSADVSDDVDAVDPTSPQSYEIVPFSVG
jgi:hypothetical protein